MNKSKAAILSKLSGSVSEKTNKWLGFQDKWTLILGIPILSFFIPILFFGQFPTENIELFIRHWITAFLYTASYWFSCRYIFIQVRKKYPDYKQIKQRILLSVGLVVVAFILIKLILVPISEVICPEEPDKGGFSLKYTVPSLTLIALISSIYESAYLYKQLKISIQEKEQLKRENIQSQLESLKNQVNPHFLFNSLNTLTYLIPEAPERAVKFVRKLSKTYRYILEIKDRKLATLKEELEFLNAYEFLLRERFGQNLTVEINIPDDYQKHSIISLSLQMLIENAIKHNIISSQHPLRIEVFVNHHGQLIVRNNLQRKKQVAPSTGTGLQNIRNRYRFFSDKEVEVITTTQYFIVSLPLIETQEAIVATT